MNYSTAGRAYHALFGMVLALFGMAACLIALMIFVTCTMRHWSYMFAWLCLASAIGLIGSVTLQRGRRYLAAGRRSLAPGRVPDVILLRSFKDDSLVFPPTRNTMFSSFFDISDRSFEALLRRECSRVGLLGAIGDPRESLPRTGAVRGYFRDDEWKEQVERYIAESRVLLAILGTTDGLDWELGQIVAKGAVSKLVLIFPMARTSHDLWDHFLVKCKEFGVSSLPTEVGEDVILVRFNENWDISCYSTGRHDADSYAVCLGAAIRDVRNGRFVRGNALTRAPFRVVSLIGAVLGAYFGAFMLPWMCMFFVTERFLAVIALVGAILGGYLGFRIKRLT